MAPPIVGISKLSAPVPSMESYLVWITASAAMSCPLNTVTSPSTTNLSRESTATVLVVQA